MTTPPFDPDGILERLKQGDPFVKVIRQSNIGSADICLKRAAYDMRPGNPRKSGEQRCVGTSYHAGLEAFYEHYQSQQADPDLFWTDARRASTMQRARDAFEQESKLFELWATSEDESWLRVVNMIDAYFAAEHFWNPLQYRVLGVEQEFFLPLTEQWSIKGSIDLVLEGPDGVVLVDHKTAGRKWPKDKHEPRKQNQAVIYCWAYWRATGVVPAYFAFDVMTYKHEFDRRRCVVTPAHMRAVLDKVAAFTGILSLPPEQLPGNPSSNLCSGLYCDYWTECPFGLELAGADAATSSHVGVTAN